METDDTPSNEDITDLESRLYGQIHHHNVSDSDHIISNLNNNNNVNVPLITNVFSLAKVKNDSQYQTTTVKINNNNTPTYKKIVPRYWEGEDTKLTGTPLKSPVAGYHHQQQQQQHSTPRISQQKFPLKNFNNNNDTENNKPIEIPLKTYTGFKPYEPIMINNNQQQQITSNRQKNKMFIDNQPSPSYRKTTFTPTANHKKHFIKFADNSTNNSELNNRKSIISNNKQNVRMTKPRERLLNRRRKRRELQKLKKKSQLDNETTSTFTGITTEIDNIIISDTNEIDDDVLIVPLSPPKVLTIHDSSDDEMTNSKNPATKKGTTEMESSFVKPHHVISGGSGTGTSSKTNRNQQQNIDKNNSRCTSPCSVISTDDFILQSDRKILVLSDKDIATDDDLVCVQETVKSFIDNRELDKNITKKTTNLPTATQTGTGAGTESMTDETISSTKSNVNNNSLDEYRNKQTTTYQQTLDVYCETESDTLPESVYSSKGLGHKKIIPNLEFTNNNVSSSSSSSSSTEDEAATTPLVVVPPNLQKIKRLRKRRVSSSNKDSEPNNESTDSELDTNDLLCDNLNSIKNNLPFINRGEAVETSKYKPKKRFIGPPSVEISSSDIEFLNMLTLISQSKVHSTNKTKTTIDIEHVTDESSDEDSNGDDDDNDNEITARKIAEDIINKKAQKSKNKSTVKKCTKNTHTNAGNNSKEEEAIFNSPELKKQFDAIDRMAIENSKTNNSSDSAEINENFDVLNETLNTTQSDEQQNKSRNSDEDCSLNLTVGDHNDDTNIIYSKSQKYIGWNDEMVSFYEQSWGEENFNVNKIRRNMERKANWSILNEDRFQTPRKYSKYRCNNCCLKGHFASQCPLPRKPIVCSMCGETGHREPRCRNTICLSCGSATRVFTKSCNKCTHQNRTICPICKIRGHSLERCPDKWRRYHSTTEANVELNSDIKYNGKKYCCICAGHGHLSEHCKFSNRFTEYPLVVTDIKSHTQSYPYQCNLPTYNESAYNLLYHPNDKFQFKFSANTQFTQKQYYGRFQEAVGFNNSPNKRKLIETNQQKSQQPREKQRKLNENNSNTSNNSTTRNIKLVTNPLAKILKKTDKKKPFKITTSSISDENIKKLVETPVEPLASGATSEVEHRFKSPDNIVITVDNERYNSKEKLNDSNIDLCKEEPLNGDSDSNYSFSDHFDKKESRPMEQLPDFISLEDTNIHENLHNSKSKKENVDVNADDDMSTLQKYETNEYFDIENTFTQQTDDNNEDAPCVAKIFLKKSLSNFLLSADGNLFLVENSNLFNIKASIDWTSVGNVLVLEGLRINQDKFHQKLLLIFKTVMEEKNRKYDERARQLPKKRSKMIRFLSEHFRKLNNCRNDNVKMILKQLKTAELSNGCYSRKNYKLAEKSRRLLNMILFGQAGLCDGQQNIDYLVKAFKNLLFQVDTEDLCTEIQNNISMSWKYIFSADKHDNYDKLVQIYFEKRRNNELPILRIDDRLLAHNILQIVFNADQKMKMLENTSNYTRKSPNASNKMNKTVVVVPPPPPSLLQTTKLTFSTNESSAINPTVTPASSENISLNVTKEMPIIDNKIDIEWEIQCMSYLTAIENCIKLKSCSAYWSKQSITVLKTCCSIYNNKTILLKKFQNILKKAYNGLLSHDDYNILLKILHTKNH